MRLFILGFLLGAWCLQQEAELRGAAAPLGLAVAAGLARILLPSRHGFARAVLALACGASLGYGWATHRAALRLADALDPALQGRDVAITGVIAGLPQAGERGTRFLFDVEQGAGVPRRISLMRYADARSEMPAFVPGQRWSFTVRLKRPRGLANPHTFDFEAWAFERGIRATGYVRPREAVLLRDERVERWDYTLHRWRHGVRESMNARLDGTAHGGVLVALAIGEQQAIRAEDWETFWRTGVGHLMSISGLHITMLAALGYAVVRFAWPRLGRLALRIPSSKAALAFGVGVAFCYSLLTGMQVPAQRTLCMLAAMALCMLLARHSSASRTLAVAALAVVAIDPWAIRATGFWLSFGAVAAIFYVMAGRTGRTRPPLRRFALEQMAVTVALLPMLLALFGELSLVSPIANAVSIPLISLVVVPLTLAGGFLGVPGVLEGAHVLLAMNMALLEGLADGPWATLESHAPPAWTVLLAVVGCAWLLAPRGVPLRSFGAVWIAPMFLLVPPGPAPGEAWLDLLDVGNGLAAVVRTAHHAIAYDAGPAWNSDADSGNRIVVPYLRGSGVRRIDGLVISHADEDHAGGAVSLAIGRQPTWLLSPLDASHPVNLVVDRSIRCERGLAWRWDGVDFEVVHPGPDTYEPANTPRRRKENDRSCVLRIATAGASLLLTGDAEARAEAEMLAATPGALRSDVLLVPHHGSRTSSTEAFLDAVAPRVALVSAGHRNSFGHPHEAVLARYARRHVEIRRTDREGALRVQLGPATSPPRVTRLVTRVRYWSDPRSAMP